jgi:hypothetical protein
MRGGKICRPRKILLENCKFGATFPRKQGAMKVLLQDCRTHRYLTQGNDWTHQTSEARNFENSEQALRTAHVRGLEHYQIVLKFEQDRYDVHLAKSAGC